MAFQWIAIQPILAGISNRAKRIHQLLGKEENWAILEKDLIHLRSALTRLEREKMLLRSWIDKIQGKQRLEEEAKYKALIGEIDFACQALDKAAKLADQTPSAGEDVSFFGVGGSLPDSDRISYQAPVENAVERQTVNLPELAMPSFDGNPLEWRNFWSIFHRAVDSQLIDPVFKLAYLKGCLKGKALNAISGFFGGVGYTDALNTLKRLFGDEELAKGILIREFLELPAAEDTLESLSEFSESLERICRELEGLGCPEDSTMYLLAKEKLPKSAITWLVSLERTLGGKRGMSGLRHALMEMISIHREVGRYCPYNPKQEALILDGSYGGANLAPVSKTTLVSGEKDMLTKAKERSERAEPEKIPKNLGEQLKMPLASVKPSVAGGQSNWPVIVAMSPKALARVERPPKAPAMAEGPPKVPAMAERPPKVPAMVEGPPKVPAMAERPPKVPAMAERPPKVPAMAEGPPKVPAMAEGPPKVPAMAERPPKVPAMAERPPKVPAMAERPPKVPAMAERPPKVPAMAERPPKVLPMAEKPTIMLDRAERPTGWPAWAERPPNVPDKTKPPNKPKALVKPFEKAAGMPQKAVGLPKKLAKTAAELPKKRQRPKKRLKAMLPKGPAESVGLIVSERQKGVEKSAKANGSLALSEADVPPEKPMTVIKPMMVWSNCTPNKLAKAAGLPKTPIKTFVPDKRLDELAKPPLKPKAGMPNHWKMSHLMTQVWPILWQCAERCDWPNAKSGCLVWHSPVKWRNWDSSAFYDRLLDASGLTFFLSDWGGSLRDNDNSLIPRRGIASPLGKGGMEDGILLPAMLGIGICTRLSYAAIAIKLTQIIKPKTNKKLLSEITAKDQCDLAGFDLNPEWFDSEWADMESGWFADEGIKPELGCFDTEWVTHGFESDHFTLGLGWADGANSPGEGINPLRITLDLEGLNEAVSLQSIPNNEAMDDLRPDMWSSNGPKERAKEFGDGLHWAVGPEISPGVELSIGIMDFEGMDGAMCPDGFPIPNHALGLGDGLIRDDAKEFGGCRCQWLASGTQGNGHGAIQWNGICSTKWNGLDTIQRNGFGTMQLNAVDRMQWKVLGEMQLNVIGTIRQKRDVTGTTMKNVDGRNDGRKDEQTQIEIEFPKYVQFITDPYTDFGGGVPEKDGCLASTGSAEDSFGKGIESRIAGKEDDHHKVAECTALKKADQKEKFSGAGIWDDSKLTSGFVGCSPTHWPICGHGSGRNNEWTGIEGICAANDIRGEQG